MVITIFRSRLKPEAVPEYNEWAPRLSALAKTMPGYVSHKAFVAVLQAPPIARLENRIAQIALHGVVGHPRFPSDAANALALHEVPPPDLADRLHRYHPRFSSAPRDL